MKYTVLPMIFIARRGGRPEGPVKTPASALLECLAGQQKYRLFRAFKYSPEVTGA